MRRSMGCFEGNSDHVAQPGEPVLACWGGRRPRLCFELSHAGNFRELCGCFRPNVTSFIMPPMPRSLPSDPKQVSGHEFTRATKPLKKSLPWPQARRASAA
jgi:hypothetical protein